MIKPIKTKKDYKAALLHIYALMQKELKPGSKQSDELEVMSILVESYEKKHSPYHRRTPLKPLSFDWNKWVWMKKS